MEPESYVFRLVVGIVSNISSCILSQTRRDKKHLL